MNAVQNLHEFPKRSSNSNETSIPPEARASIAAQFERLVVEYGDSQIATKRQYEMKMLEWAEAFGAVPAGILRQAVTKCISQGEHWPRISHVQRAVADLMPAPERRNVWRAEEQAPEPFCRDGRTEAEEIAHRAAQCRRWRAQAAVLWQSEPEEKAPPKPASQEGLTPEFIAHAKKRGIYRGTGVDG